MVRDGGGGNRAPPQRDNKERDERGPVPFPTSSLRSSVTMIKGLKDPSCYFGWLLASVTDDRWTQWADHPPYRRLTASLTADGNGDEWPEARAQRETKDTRHRPQPLAESKEWIIGCGPRVREMKGMSFVPFVRLSSLSLGPKERASVSMI